MGVPRREVPGSIVEFSQAELSGSCRTAEAMEGLPLLKARVFPTPTNVVGVNAMRRDANDAKDPPLLKARV